MNGDNSHLDFTHDDSDAKGVPAKSGYKLIGGGAVKGEVEALLIWLKIPDS